MNKHFQHTPDQNNSKKKNNSIFGILLILFGGALVLNNLDLIPYSLENVVFSWPMLLITLGALFAFAKDDRTTGFTLMLIGGAFILPRLFDWHYDLHKFFWPVLLIVLGIIVIRKRNFCPSNTSCKTEESTDYINELNIFGGGERIVNTKNFKGGNITCMFGGGEVDLSYAELAEGTHTIEVFAMFGGSSIIVPPDWDVKVSISAVLGGVSDKRRPIPNYIVEPKKELIIKGFVALGGCEIKSSK
ncbi:MAG: putative membrane protein [Ancylomarina sp.]|jgi:predicted membrane protein